MKKILDKLKAQRRESDANNIGFIAYERENDPTTPENLYFAGRTDEDGRTTGVGTHYAGGAAWQDTFIYKGIIVPCIDKDGDTMEDSDMEGILRGLAGNDFIDNCYDRINEHIEMKTEGSWIYFDLKQGSFDEDGVLMEGTVYPPNYSEDVDGVPAVVTPDNETVFLELAAQVDRADTKEQVVGIESTLGDDADINNDSPVIKNA